ncbi:MAG TPA: 30S ribosomal protein S8 [Anaerolineae bacterium]|nr:30S ribosomal protein S8 [Anaerolineae bacterium]
MTMTDPIADMLTRIRNAIMAGHSTVLVPSSKVKLAIVRILKEEGFIEGYEVTKDRPQPMIKIRLKYVGEKKERQCVINGLKRISKPGRRVYTKKKDIPWVLSGMGIAILSTPKGIMTDKKARRLGVGGEVLCYVW